MSFDHPYLIPKSIKPSQISGIWFLEGQQPGGTPPDRHSGLTKSGTCREYSNIQFAPSIRWPLEQNKNRIESGGHFIAKPITKTLHSLWLLYWPPPFGKAESIIWSDPIISATPRRRRRGRHGRTPQSMTSCPGTKTELLLSSPGIIAVARKGIK